MYEKLSWPALRNRYDGKWVELVDFQWHWNEPTPRWAVVRHHAFQRRALDLQIKRSPAVPDAVILYLGAVQSSIELSEHTATL